jgi:phytanoyl-CoA hydroxylase
MSVLSNAQVRFFREEGYLVAEDVLDVERDLRPVVDEYASLLDRMAAQWNAEGKLPSTYAELPFAERWTKIIASGQADYRPFDISLTLGDVQEDSPIHLGPAVFNLLRSRRLLDAVESLIGSEILSNPVQHVRIKPPERLLQDGQRSSLVGATDWHQDQGVVLDEADATEILTVWLPVFDATLENGCLRLEPRSHREDLVPHCTGPGGRAGLHIPDELLRKDRIIPVPVQRGGVLFMHRRTKHASLPNVSDTIRWSFDLRYNPIGQPTGRPMFPSWVARSRAHPETELWDPTEWARLWLASRDRLAGKGKQVTNRWGLEPPVCAEVVPAMVGPR